MKIFVLHQGALGDLILSLPSLWAIRRYFPASPVHLFSRTDLAGIIIKNYLADKVSSNDTGLFAELFVDRESLPGWGEELPGRFDAAFVFMRSPDGCVLKNLQRYIPRCSFVRTVPPDGVSMSVSDFQLSELRREGIEADCPMPTLAAPAVFSGGGPGKTVIALHPGSGGGKKCWPLDRYLELISVLQTGNECYFHILLGPAEEGGVVKKIENFVRGNGIDAGILRNSSLSVVAAALKSSSLYVGNDSGITHLSSALGTPTIAVFGPTDPRKWGPRGNVRIVQPDLACSPCREYDYRNCVDVRCIGSVQVERVISAAQELLNITGAETTSGCRSSAGYAPSGMRSILPQREGRVLPAPRRRTCIPPSAD
jgi:ADP-heptose:LPS heptosyltransferase